MNIKRAHADIIEKYTLHKNFFTQKLLNNILDKIGNETDNLEITADLFKTENIYINFKKQYSGNRYFVTPNNQHTLYIGTGLMRDLKLIKQQKEEEKKYTNNTMWTYQDQEEEDHTIQNIFTLEEFITNTKEKIGKKLLTLNDEQKTILEKYIQINALNTVNKTYYVSDTNVEFDNIMTLNNKEIEGKFEVLPNPLIAETKIMSGQERTIYNQQYANKLIKINIKILKPTTSGVGGIKFVTKYMYKCPRCKTVTYRLPMEMTKDISHGCDGWINNNGNQKFQPIEKSGFHIENFQNLHLYDFEITCADKIKQIGVSPKLVIYSDNIKINPGTYSVEVLISTRKLSRGQDEHNIIYLVSLTPLKPEVDLELIEEGCGRVISTELEIPHTRILDVIQSIRNIYKDYAGEEISNHGMWLQITTLISGIARTMFNFRCVGISVVGNKSLSKTYPATRIGIMIDPQYYFSHSSDDITRAGFIGGINNKKEVNGNTISIFEAGVVSSTGLCIFDEASAFYTHPELNLAVKSLFEPILSIKKIGGGEVPQNYTPVFLSNFAQHDSEYKYKVKETYLRLKRLEQNQSGKLTNEVEMEDKLSTINYYLPLNKYETEYKDSTLVESITQVRYVYQKQKHIDWKTGGRIESSDRIFFDVVVENKEKTIMDGFAIDTRCTNLAPPSAEQLPIEEFQKELQLKFNSKTVNLGAIYNNKPKVIVQINNLQADIVSWLNNNGKGSNIFHTYANGEIKIDPKMNAVLFNVCMVVQLFEDINSTELSYNVKKFLEVVLTKNKRGLSVDEYNYEDNDTKYDMINFKINNITMKMIQVKEIEDKELMRKQIMKELKENNEVEITEDEEIDDEVASNMG